MRQEFKDKTILVTGALSGIGKKIAIDFLKQGAQVIVNYPFDVENFNSIEKEFNNFNGKCTLAKADISNYNEVVNMKNQLKKKGIINIDILINNAGITKDKSLKNMSKEDWDSVINVNLNGVFNITKVFLDMINENGRIISMSSIVGVRGNFGQTNYSASKAGIIGFTKSLSKEVGKRNITVNAIAPGFINTNMVKTIPDEFKQKILSVLSIKKFGEVEDISYAIQFLASSHAGYITGQVLEITGGLSL